VLIANLSASRMAEQRTRFTMLIGQVLFAVGCFPLLISAQWSSLESAAQLLAIGAGIGIAVPPMTSVLLGAVEKRIFRDCIGGLHRAFLTSPGRPVAFLELPCLVR
jgi:MFS transporter, DHA2 family, methylenomycin A resistance protein